MNWATTRLVGATGRSPLDVYRLQADLPGYELAVIVGVAEGEL